MMRAVWAGLCGAARRWGDALVVAALGGLGLFEILVAPLDTWVFPGSPWRHLPFLTMAVVPLLWRRRAPVLVLAAVTAASVAWMYGTLDAAQAPIHPFMAQLLATYTVAATTHGQQLRRGLGVLAVLLLGDLPGLAFLDRSADTVFPSWVLLGLSVAVGRVVADRVRLAERLAETAAALEAERDARTAEAVTSERVRIARELHDVITHAMSGIVVHAGVEARAAAAHDGEAAQALASIECSGREVLVELRRLLGALHTTPCEDLTPQPSLRNIDALLEPLHRAGVDVSVDRDGDLEHLPAGVDLSAYRIIQEAVTNVLKHADARAVAVRVRRGNGHVDLEVTDDGHGGVPVEGGHGLVGMRERARLCGGTLHAGPLTSGGFGVRTRLPVDSRPT